MDQNLNRAALDLLLQPGEFLFESLAAPPLSQPTEHQEHHLHHEALRCHNGGYCLCGKKKEIDLQDTSKHRVLVVRRCFICLQLLILQRGEVERVKGIESFQAVLVTSASKLFCLA